MKLGGYRVLPNSLRTTSVQRKLIKKPVSKKSPKPIMIIEEEGSLEKKIDNLFSGQDLLFERLHSEPKWHHHAYRKAKSTTKSASTFVRKQPMVARVAILLVPLALGGLTIGLLTGGSRGDISQVAGVTDSSSSSSQSEAGPGVKPSFSMLLPEGKSPEQVTFAKVSPEGNAPVYAFLDQIGSTQIKISQQELPEQFKSNPSAELERVAQSFQATDIIQIDSMKVFHGLSDRTKVQSLVFVKNDRLVFIASPDKLADDVWAGYIINLQ